MKRNLLVIVWVLVFLLGSISAAFAGIEVIKPGSYIVNMGVVPQTVGNGLKPYGLVYDLLKNYKVPVKWVITPAKAKDGIDFSHNGVNYTSGAFIIPAEYRTLAVNAAIASWVAQGVVGSTSIASLSVNVHTTLKHPPVWTLDKTSGSIAVAYFVNAGIPASAYGGSTSAGWKDAADLAACDDLFVLPHATPTWATHSGLYNWISGNKGNLWTGCETASALENTSNTGNTIRMNFLSTNGLVANTAHADGTMPYLYAASDHPVMQLRKTLDNATNNGTEKIYLPAGGSWRASTTLGVYNNVQANIPTLSAGPSAALAYGRAYGDNNRGWVMYEAGHNLNTTGTIAERVAAQRAFFNFSFFTSADKNAPFDITITGVPSQMNVGVPVNLSFTVPGGVNLSKYTIQWSSSLGGTFSPNATQQSVTFTPSSTSGNNIISVTLTDTCNRQVFGSAGSYTCPDNFTIANAGVDRSVCMQDTVQLNANTPVVGTGSWTQASGPNTAVFTNINQPNTVATSLVTGTYKFVWTIGNGVCSSAPDTVNVVVAPYTVRGKVSGTTNVCSGTNTGSVVLSGYTGTIQSWERSTNNGTTWTTISNTTATQSYSNLTATTWFRAFVKSGSCPGLYSDTAVITVYPNVTTANGGRDRTICLQDTVKLHPNVPVSGTGAWNQLTGPTSLVFTKVADTTVLSNLKNGTYTILWTISNGVCAHRIVTVNMTKKAASAIPGLNGSSPSHLLGYNSSA